MPDDKRGRHRLSLEDRLVMREAEIDILLAAVHAERHTAARLRRALQHIDMNHSADRDEIIRLVREALAEDGC